MVVQGQYFQQRPITVKTDGYTGVLIPTSKFTSANSFLLEE